MPATQPVLQSILNRRVLICAFTGFASGLPFFFLIQFIPAWLRTEGVGLKEIGFFSLVTLPYVWKFAWAPLVDRYSMPWLGHRRGWMLVTQLGLLGLMMALGQWRPLADLDAILWLAAIVAFFSATQDIVLDAYRRELLPDHELGIGNAVHIQAYRLAGLIPGALGLVLADQLSWDATFAIVGAFMLVGVGMTLCIDEISVPNHPSTLRRALVDPFKEFVTRKGVGLALLTLAFLFFYKLGDSMATALSTPFYIDLGFSLTEIGLIAKNAALWPSIVGGIVGGVLMIRMGINRALWLFGAVQLATILGFAVLAEVGHDRWALALVISLEYLGVGLGTAAFVAFMARETTPAMAATQIALFTALAALPRTFGNAITGFLVEGGSDVASTGVEAAVLATLMALGLPEAGLGWTRFFLLCTVLAVPGMVLLIWVAPYRSEPSGCQPKRAREMRPLRTSTPSLRNRALCSR
ncbi:MAG: AmpG family muropeptide MFS transporter, partial [Gammaproteobacteria bacterium]|nr:AmpG family muropeptide MFS transporter [Gammaproteobacteria bacterium]